MTTPRGLTTLIQGRVSLPLAIIAAALLTLISCEKPDDLGKHIITRPGEEFVVRVNDTTSVIGHTLREDSIKTSGTFRNVLGAAYDPVFGLTEASIYTQLRLSTNNLNFGDNPKLDSIVLWLQYQGEYAMNPLSKWDRRVKVSVFELTGDMKADSSYYSNHSIAYDPAPIGEIELIPRVSDSLYLDSQYLAPQFRVPLSPAFGQKILNGSGTVYLSDNDNFLDYIKGIHIKATNLNNRGSLSYINLVGAYSRVLLYYHNDEDTLSQSFVINENCARFTAIDHHDYQDARADLQSQILNGGDTLLGKDKLFIQPLGGMRTKIYFPFIRNWVDGDRKIAISKAELIIKADQTESSLGKLTPPATLSLAKIREDGSSAFLTDYTTEGSEYFGGTYDADRQEYVFNVAWHIQELLDGRSVDYGLYLAVSGNAVYANRVILGGSDTQDRIRLVLTYIEIE